MRPAEEPHGDFVGSDACIACHTGQHQSWSNSWHRTMTQQARLDSFVGELNLEIESEGTRYRLFARDGLPWFRLDHQPTDFTPLDDGRSEFPIVMTTGSHLMQLGWFPIGHARTLGLLPVAYLKEDRRWVPHASIFLHPPDSRSSTRVGIWNEGCLRCHTTGPEIRRGNNDHFDRRFGFDTRVAEFGISCEACHGPAREHARLQREAGTDGSLSHDPIVNPKSLNHVRASEICGACHGDTRPRSAVKSSPYHLPGHPLSERYIVNEIPRNPQSQPDSGNESGGASTMYWTDGQARVSGTAFSALQISRCYTEGEISCLTCHSLHQSPDDSRSADNWADDLLRPKALGDEVCLTCHEKADYASHSHTIHGDDSTGSRCYNCHQPHTSYGLLKAIRSHSITSPSTAETIATGRLNACNLCHLDRTLEWTDIQMHRHYDHPRHDLPKIQKEIAAAALQALTGDAGQRVLVAWAMSWPPAREASGGADWIPPHLANLLDDPYSAVRYVAGRSIREFDGFESFNYDYLAPAAQRSETTARIIATWRGKPLRETMISDSGALDSARFRLLGSDRNDTPITLLE